MATTPGVTGIRLIAYFPFHLPGIDAAAPDRLKRLTALGWHASDTKGDLALQPYGDGLLDELLRSMPHAVLELSGGQELLRTAPDREPATELTPGGQGGDGPWPLVDVRLSVWNVGCGLATIAYDLPAAMWSDLPGAVVTSAAAVQAMVPAVTDLLRATLGGGTDESEPSILWANSTYAVQVDHQVGEPARQAMAGAVTADGFDCTPDGMAPSVLRVGSHSVAVTEDFADPGARLLFRLAGVHHVCWAAAMTYDATLSAELSQIEPGRAGLSLTDLEGQADRILTDYHRIRLFRLRYSSVEAHLDAGAGRVWSALEREWKFRLVLASLDDRLDFVRTLHQQLFGRLQDRRSRLLNELVLAFTFLNIFAIVLAALNFVTVPVATVSVAGAAISVVALVLNLSAYLVFRRRIDRPR